MMIRKLVLLATAVSAVTALAAPGVASATKATMPLNTLVPVSTKVTGTANKTTLPLHTETETFGKVECEEVMLNGQMTKNDGTTAEGKGLAGSTATGCTIEGETPVTVSGIEVINVSSTGAGGETGTGKFSAKYSTNIHGFVCNFDTKGENGVFHFTLHTDRMIITPTTVTSSGCGESTLTGEVTLETAPPNSGPVLGS